MATSNYEIGARRILFGTSGSEAQLGDTVGPVTVTVEIDEQMIGSNEYPSYDGTWKISAITVNAELADVQDTEILATVFNGTEVTNGSDTKVTVEGGQQKYSTAAKSLILRPIEDADADPVVKDHDLTFASAVVMIGGEMSFADDQQAVLPISFKILKDDTSGWFTYGDPSVTSA